MKRWLFIPFLLVLFMSHNVSALNLNYDLNNYSLVNSGSLTVDCSFSYNTWVTGGRVCRINNNSSSSGNIFGVRSRTTYNFKKGDLVELYVTVQSNPSSDLSGSYNYLYKYLPTYWTSTDFNVLSFESVNDLSIVYQQLPNTDTFSCSDLDQNSFYCTATHTNTWTNSFIFQVYRVVLSAKADGNYYISLNSIADSRPLGQCLFDPVGSPYCDVYIGNYNYYTFIGSEENREQAEATQEQVDNSEDASDDAQDSVDGASGSLLSNIGSIISAIRDTPATDCYINVATTQFTVGNLNLCQGVPSSILNSIRVLAALVITPLVLRACYVIVRAMIDKFHEVQDT